MIWPTADISAFLAAMGTAVNIDNGSINGSSITGIFEAPFEAVNQFSGAVEMSAPSLMVATSDVVNFLEHQTRAYVAETATDYLVTGIQNNNDGWTRLILREA